MANYIEDGTTDYGSPSDTDVFPKSTQSVKTGVAANKKLRSADWNIGIQALQDIRHYALCALPWSIVDYSVDNDLGFVNPYDFTVGGAFQLTRILKVKGLRISY